MLGYLVSSRTNNLGIGKIIETSNSQATVEYFCSVGQSIKKSIPVSSLYRVKLQQQTRCYIKPEHSDVWRIGRIFAWDEDCEQYQIDLPDKKSTLAPEQEVYVRCHLPIEDPAEILAIKGHETPYFHDRRFAYIKNLIEQRAVSRGMTGLISANIQLFPHQVEVVRRVLEDPIQRYLLADEVGLGKTIEAGAILRQYLLDETSGRALVITPQYLLKQWQQELEAKFYLSHFPDRVKLIAVEDINKIKYDSNVGFVILDEAHHIAAMATSKDTKQHECFEYCKYFAHKSDRLLLLSATPVLNNEQDFLAMLHLLDPDSYKLNDLDSFRDKVAKRQDIGRVLLSFKEGANPFVLTTNLKKLCELFAEDKYLLALGNDLQKKLEEKSDKTDKAVRAIRTHISDTYRLHRRMLRNRRANVEDVIFDRSVTPQPEYDLDERSSTILELLEEWRGSAPDERKYHRIFLLLFRASGTWLGILKQVVQARLNSTYPDTLIRDFGKRYLKVLTETPLFDGEEEILRSLLKTVEQPSEDGDSIELLKTIVLYHLSERFRLQSFRSNMDKLLAEVQKRLRRPVPGDSLPKIVVFTSFTQAGEQIVRLLGSSLGEGCVVSHLFGQPRAQVEQNINRFKKERNCFILVCDSSGEEGLNLQFADWMIHFDIPWSPNRLEQRIGRVDRIGRPLKIEFTVFAGADLPGALQEGWYRLLKDGFNIFQQSIASLQFYIDEKLSQLEEILFKSGANGLIEIIEKVKEEIHQEEVKISEQNTLDEIDAFDVGAVQYFKALDDYDANHQQIERVTNSWICDALRFKPIEHPDIKGANRYKPTQKTLIPADELSKHFAGVLEEFGTFNRRLANQKPGTKLYRIGEEFIDALSSYIQWDDRGQAFAMWRVEETWSQEEGQEWFGFRFNYIIETNLSVNTNENINTKILQRRADGLFPPRIVSIFLDARDEAMSSVEDKALLDILQRPYRGKGSNFRDFNLAKGRLAILDNFIESSDWQTFCYHAHSASSEHLLQNPDFKEMCDGYAQRAEKKLGRRVEQLRLRLTKTNESKQELKDEMKLNNAILEGIRKPTIRLDSIGFIIVSGRPPAASEEDD